MPSSIIDSSIFDSRPLDKRNQKQKLECQLKEKLEKAIEECLSEYMLTSFKKQISRDFHLHDQISSPKGIRKQSSRASDEIKNVVLGFKSNSKSVQNQVIHRVKSNIESLASSVLRIFEGQSQYEHLKSSHQDQSKSLSLGLNQSNKCFLVELFTQFGLLKNYLQMDRSFVKLVNEAQRSYFEIKKKAQSIGSQMLQKLNLDSFGQQSSEIMKEKEIDIETLSTFYSAKRRIFDTLQRQNSETKRTLSSGSSVIGYTSFEQLHDNLFAKVYERYKKYDKLRQ